MKPNRVNLNVYYYSGDSSAKKKMFGKDPHQSHVERLQTMRGAIDNKPPKTMLGGASDAKRQSALQDKLARIMNRAPETATASLYSPRRNNPFEEKREKEAKRVERENEALIRRIRAVSLHSAYDRSKLLMERLENEKYIRRLGHYAPPAYLGSAASRPSSTTRPSRPASAWPASNSKGGAKGSGARLLSAMPVTNGGKSMNKFARVASAPAATTGNVRFTSTNGDTSDGEVAEEVVEETNMASVHAAGGAVPIIKDKQREQTVQA